MRWPWHREPPVPQVLVDGIARAALAELAAQDAASPDERQTAKMMGAIFSHGFGLEHINKAWHEAREHSISLKTEWRQIVQPMRKRQYEGEIQRIHSRIRELAPTTQETK